MLWSCRVVPAVGRQRPFTRAKYPRYPEGRWALRKMLWRLLEHEKKHYGTISLALKALEG